MLKIIYLFLLTALLSGCRHNNLSVQSYYLNRSDLASYYIGTPDPRLYCPLLGQRLLIDWYLPKDCTLEDSFLRLNLHFYNHTQEVLDIPIHRKKGTFDYLLKDDEFLEKEGIQTYKVQLINGDHILAEWRHILWTEWISVCDEDNEEENINMETE